MMQHSTTDYTNAIIETRRSQGEFWEILDFSHSAALQPVQEQMRFTDELTLPDTKENQTHIAAAQQRQQKGKKRKRIVVRTDNAPKDVEMAQKAKKKRCRSDRGSKKTLIAPHVLATLPKIKKYPGQFKELFDETLRRNGVAFQVHPSARTMMMRPATKDIGKYWYVIWQFIFAYVAEYPQWMLHRCTRHVQKLL